MVVGENKKKAKKTNKAGLKARKGQAVRNAKLITLLKPTKSIDFLEIGEKRASENNARRRENKNSQEKRTNILSWGGQKVGEKMT